MSVDNDSSFEALKCKKCLLYELSEANQYQNVYEYINNLDEELKVPDSLYQERLSICKQCDYLLAGMCRLCGCYVEMRAIMKQRHCPSTDKLW